MIILEDNRWYTEWSCLYDILYGKENVKFSMGSGSLKRVISDYIHSESEIFVYVDVVPENTDTTDIVFRNLIEKYYNKSNVYIIPVLCAEYCLLKSFVEGGLIYLSDEDRKVLNFEVSYFNTKYSNYGSFEKVMKAMLSGYFEDMNLRGLCESLSVKDASRFLVNHTAYNSIDKIENTLRG